MRTVAFWLSLILIFVIPWENAVFFPGLGTAGRATGLLVAAFWVVTVVVTGRFRKPDPFHLVVYLFVLWNTVSAFWTCNVKLTVTRIQTYFQLLALVWILWDLYTTPAALKAGLQAYVLGACVSIGSTVASYLAGGGVGSGRYAAAGFDPNDMGIILALGIPVAWYLALSEGNSSKTAHVLRWVNYAYVPAATLTIVLTASRGSLVATLPAFLFVLASLTQLKFHLRVLLFVALVGTLVALQLLVPQSSIQRLATTGTSIAEGDLGGRVHIWRQGIAVFSQHPLLGVGSGAGRAAIGSAPHNSYLSVLVDIGIVGFVLFVIILAMTVYRAMHQSKWDSRLWLTVLSVWALGVFALGWEHRKPTWLFLGLAAVSAGLSAQRDESVLCTEFPVQSASSPSE